MCPWLHPDETRKEKGLFLINRNKPSKQVSFRLEADPQAELHVPSIQSTGGLAKIRSGQEGASKRIGVEVLVVRPAASRGENEVGAVENVKRIRIELHIDPFGDLEGLGQSHISGPVAWANECIPSQIACAAEAWR